MIPQHGTLEISRSRMRHNLALLQSRAGGARVCPVIKANAYGHSTEIIAPLLADLGIQWAAVYNLQEAVALARGTGLNILALAPLVMTEAEPEMLQRLAEWSDIPIRLNVTDVQTARFLAGAVPAGVGAWPIHVQIDTGLTRVGIAAERALELLEALAAIPKLEFEGIFAHFSHGDVPGHATLARQLQTLQAIAGPFKKRFPNLLVHAQNSGGIWHLGDAGMNMVRLGIALYGMQPSTGERIAGLLPIARIVARVLAVHERPAGTGVGYGHTFVTRRPSRLAVVPVGYADGYPRQMSGRGVAQVRGLEVPVVGRVSMDQIILDVTDVEGAVLPGEPVTVVSWDPERRNCLDAMADAIGTIGYELATHLGAAGGRLRRVVVD